MAVTLTRRQTDKARELIKVEKICLRLSDHIEGKIDLKSTQINAARILLDKSMPSLVATNISTEGGNDMPILTIVPADAA